MVEDDRELREMLGELLEDVGYKVIKAVDGEDAVQKFKEARDDVHLVILDVIMPKINGKDAYHTITALSPGVKVLFMSGYTGDIISDEFITAGIFAFVPKPINMNEFLFKVRKMMDNYWK